MNNNLKVAESNQLPVVGSQSVLADYPIRNMIIYAVCSIIISCTYSVAQNKLKDTVIVDVVKEFKPSIANAVKINDNPVINDTTRKIVSLNYSIQSKKINTSFDIEPIRPARMVGEPLAKLYSALLKAGFGNYTTPYGEFFYNNLRSKDHSYGVHLKHLSSAATLKDHGFAGYSDNEANLYGKKFLNKQTLSGDLDYSRNVVHQYGYDAAVFSPKRDSTRQRFSFINPKTQLISYYTDSSRVNHNIKLGYYNFNDINKAGENNFIGDASFRTYLVSGELLTVKAIADHYNNSAPTYTVSNTIVKLNPTISSEGTRWKASLGLSAVGDFGTGNTFHFYPNIDFNYHVINNILIPYAGISGERNKNSFRSLAVANPFIVSDPLLKNSDNKYNAWAGVRGTLDAATSFNLKGTYARINNMPFFVNTTGGLKNKFDVIYDDISLLNVHGEIVYQKNEKLRLLAKGDYYDYTMKNEMAAWYKPKMEFTLSGNYNIKDKIIAKADIFVLGKQYAKVFTEVADSAATVFVAGKKELKGITDINIGIEYRYTKKLSAFVNFNNILVFRYYRWNNYPAQRFNFLAGFSYIF